MSRTSQTLSPFFSHAAAAHRPPHSFPTRRSSDLSVFAHPDRIVRKNVDHRNFHQRCQPDRRTQIVAEYQEARSKRPHLGSGDRKSTRLNSSHVAISYAVFCLKKKKY